MSGGHKQAGGLSKSIIIHSPLISFPNSCLTDFTNQINLGKTKCTTKSIKANITPLLHQLYGLKGNLSH